VAGALETLVERLRKTTSAAEWHLHVDPRAATLAPRLGLQVLNVVQEAASNAMRHAEARRIDIRLEWVPGQTGAAHWRLEVSDDGHGFDPAQARNRGHGLRNFEARAEELGGHSRVESKPGGGTHIILEFPT